MPNEIAPPVIFPVRDPAWLYVPRAGVVVPELYIETWYVLTEIRDDIALEDDSGFLLLESYET